MDKKTKILLVVLGILVLGVLYLIFFTGGNTKTKGKNVDKLNPIGYDSTAVIISESKTGPFIGYFDETLPAGMQKTMRRGEYVWEKDQSVMLYVPPGRFILGNLEIDEAQPKRDVELSGYYIDKYEVTVKQYREFCLQTKKKMTEQPNWSEDDHPVVFVTWYDVIEYARWVGKELPTEAQWEKAAKGGDKIPLWGGGHIPIIMIVNTLPDRRYPWGDSAPGIENSYRCNFLAEDEDVNMGKDGYVHTAAVGTFVYHEGSVYGCCDLIGNVREWCYDVYRYQYKDIPNKDPMGPAEGDFRVIRGGGWKSPAKQCRLSTRLGEGPDRAYEDLGFRLVKSQK